MLAERRSEEKLEGCRRYENEKCAAKLENKDTGVHNLGCRGRQQRGANGILMLDQEKLGGRHTINTSASRNAARFCVQKQGGRKKRGQKGMSRVPQRGVHKTIKSARVLKYTAGTEDNAKAVGKATRGRDGYPEDGMVKKERLVHCDKGRKCVIRVEIDTQDKKSQGVNMEARIRTR